MLDKKKAKVKELERLAGLLNFLTRAIVPGRVFTRHMYAKFTNLRTLKAYPHIRLDKEFKDDCRVWKSFLSSVNNYSISRPYMDIQGQEAETLDFMSDTSASENLGFGCVYKNAWTYSKWEPGFINMNSPNIEFLEIYALCMGVFIWAPKLSNRRVVIQCDNEAVVYMVNATTSGCRFCMVLLCKLVLKCLQFNMRIFCRHLSGRLNKLLTVCLDLSWNSSKVLHLIWDKNLNQEPENLSTELWPLTLLWNDTCVQLC